MQSVHKKQYTIRGLEPQLDKSLRKQAAQTGKSLNEVTLDALRKGIGLTGEPILYRDLDFLAGTWRDDPEFERVLQEQDRIDSEIWS